MCIIIFSKRKIKFDPKQIATEGILTVLYSEHHSESSGILIPRVSPVYKKKTLMKVLTLLQYT